MTQPIPTWRSLARICGLAGLAVPVLLFAAYSLRFGLRGLTSDLSAQTYLFTPDRHIVNAAISAHMLLGGLVMALVPFQLVRGLRLRFPRLHRIAGRVIVASALVVALGGLGYIARRGTIAGPLMDLGFALYGALMIGAAVQTFRFARKRDIPGHRAWALRLLVLIMGSLIFRVHYVVWYILTDGAWSNEALTGPFDQVQYFAFYLPYLALLELWIRRRAQ